MTKVPGLLQQELKQSKPFESVAQEAVLGVVRTADLLKRQMAALLEPFGISIQQYNVLRILRGAGEDGIPTLEIGDRMIEKSPGITRLIDRLVQHGWADRERCSDDRRVVYCRISAAGLALLAEVDPPLMRAPEDFVSRLTEAERLELVKLLELVRGSSEGLDSGDQDDS